MLVRSRVVWVLSFVAISAFLVTCGGDPPTTPVTPTPVPADTPTAEPTPSPTALPGTACGLPALTEWRGRCSREAQGGTFQTQYDDAVTELIAEEPGIFRNGGTHVVNVGAYHAGIIRNLEERGLCAYWDGEEIAIKNTQDYSEQFHPDFSTFAVVKGPKAYRATCRPAAFPINPGHLAPLGHCELPPSRDMGCTRLETALFKELTDRIADEITADRPDIVSNRRVAYENWNEYFDEFVKRLRAEGLCAIFDGEEIAVKNSNFVSEQYHVLLSSGEIRKSNKGSYRASCSPAAF
jgi:hypothetical protein